MDECPKSYGSEGSLNQHVKLKHYEFYVKTFQEQGPEGVVALSKLLPGDRSMDDQDYSSSPN